MTPEEQNAFLSAEYAEAIRYMDNAKETLRKAGRNGSRYVDRKYVKTACGAAGWVAPNYNSVWVIR